MNWAIAGFITATLAFAMTLFAARLIAYRAKYSESSDAENGRGFSRRRYESMARLLSREDLKFLQSQPGYCREIGARLMRDRRRVFRMYLSELSSEFHRLHAAARRIAAESPAERSDLVSKLVRQQLMFWRTMAMLELRMLVPGLNVDASRLVHSIETMQGNLDQPAEAA